MKKPKFYIGIDIAADTFAVSILTQENSLVARKEEFANKNGGFTLLIKWLKQCKVKASDTVVCMEHTGVYMEALSAFLYAKKFVIWQESALKVKRAFKLSTHKTDAVDSEQIAQYAVRFLDQLQPYQPKSLRVERIKTLLQTREFFTTQLTANKNAKKALERKVANVNKVISFYRSNIDSLSKTIKEMNEEIKLLIDEDSFLKDQVNLLMSIPSVGLLLSANLLVLSNGFTQQLNAKKLSAHAGICPYQHQSGSSIRRRAKSRQYGPKILRKLMYLASISLRMHHDKFKKYFFRKVEEGKCKKIALNNIANKLLKIICAVLKNQQVYILGYRSVSPVLLKKS